MYPEFNAARARKKLTLAKVSEKLKEYGVDLAQSQLSEKLSGKYPIKFTEAVALKKVVESDLPLEVLFATEEAS